MKKFYDNQNHGLIKELYLTPKALHPQEARSEISSNVRPELDVVCRRDSFEIEAWADASFTRDLKKRGCQQAAISPY